MASFGASGRRSGDSQFFQPMGAGVGAMFGPPATAQRPPAGTPPKLAVHDMYRRWFQMADLDNDGRLTGQDAVRFFECSQLPHPLLAKVWAASDSRKQGFLDFPAFVKALELVSLAQTTGEVSMDTYNNMQPVGIEPPRMLGLNVDPSLAASAAGASVAAAHAQAASAALAAATTAAAAARSGGGGGGSSAGPTGPPGAGMEALSLQPFAGTPGGGSLAGEAGVVHRSLDVGRTADARRSMPELGRPGPDGSWRSVSDVAQRPAPAGSTHGSEDGGEAEWRGMPEPGRHGGNAQRSAEGGARLAPGMAAGAAAAAAAAGAAAAGPGSDGRRSMEAPALSIPSPMPTPGGGGGMQGAFFPQPSPLGTSPYASPSFFGEASPSPGAGLFGGGRKKGRRAPLTTKDCTSITDGLKKIYFQKIRPLEDVYKFGHFFSPLMSEGDFEAKPSVLLLGQYSTGKSTFIKYLLGRDYPGIHIGPEPTTDRFVVVMHGPEERRTPGNTLVVQPDRPFTGLQQFGSGFLSKFEAAQCDNRLLEEVTLVDTPGVLSGEKQRIERSYDFVQVCGWFAARCDLVLLLFDPHKLDISDEFKAVISTLRGHDDKVRVVLNKADSVDPQQLMRVYGALMWSLGRIFRSPEVCRVYIGSFNAGAPIREDVNPAGRPLFEREQEDLLHDLYDIPARSCDRRVADFVKRVRAAKIHFLIMGHLRKQLPYFGQKKAQDKLLDNLAQEFAQVQREHHLHPGDFPDVNRYREILSAFDLSRFPKLDKAMLRQVDDALSLDIPALMRQMENPWT
ncbi:EH domain-containing 1-like [Micractinium conductrix]|uniref:EH domain-containing 1-like n=1 Tax=Micractinium conductrix TaxID=554055 RepID=A0A2P6VLJ8_9CHLO|nr:EH domain-containing 1-like [Micractinium conductrix]|eukprot:PSC74976.1 EH domain-containing 1-like [Micractinium conductrix]